MLTLWREELAGRLDGLKQLPLPLDVPDKWIAHSVLHKAIRRSNAELARAAGLALLKLDAPGLWRRLLTIAFEDVGIGDQNAVVTTAASASDSAWRRKVGGDEPVAAALCSMLACAPKDRSSDNLICAARSHPGLEEFREVAGSCPVPDRLALVRDAAQPIAARAVAAWYASGIEWYPEKRVGPGDLDGLLDCYAELGASPALVAATRIAAKRVHEPIVLMVPLLAALEREPAIITQGEVPPERYVDGIPLHALDRFTRVGKAAIGQLVKANGPLRDLLGDIAPEHRWPTLLCLSVFHAEGGRLADRYTWRECAPLEQLGIEADFLPLGLSPDAAQRLIEFTERELGHLNTIRADVLSRHPPNSSAGSNTAAPEGADGTNGHPATTHQFRAQRRPQAAQGATIHRGKE